MQLIDELETHSGETTLEFRKKMAICAFTKSCEYDSKIASWLMNSVSFTQHLTEKIPLAYGENPHQAAGFYVQEHELPRFSLLQGKPLSYNNILDLDAGIRLVLDFEEATATVIKHTNPCGAAVGKDSYSALSNAFQADSKSAFGGIVVLNKTMDELCATFLTPHFVEIIAAPDFTQEALVVLSKKPKLRVICYQSSKIQSGREIKSALGGVLVQDNSNSLISYDNVTIPTECKPTIDALNNLLFAFKIARHTKSNAIVIAHLGVSISIGAGQTSRVDACELALKKAQNHCLKQAVLASDGFFPFVDCIALIAKAGIKWIIQPGGSIRDLDVIAACNQAGIGMVFTGSGGFKH